MRNVTQGVFYFVLESYCRRHKGRYLLSLRRSVEGVCLIKIPSVFEKREIGIRYGSCSSQRVMITLP